jgi:hypothetical protein
VDRVGYAASLGIADPKAAIYYRWSFIKRQNVKRLPRLGYDEPILNLGMRLHFEIFSFMLMNP